MSEALVRALIIEDSPTDQKALSYILTQRLHCTVDCAEDGLAGLRMLSRVRYSVVFLDMFMPNMNGDKVLERIRARTDIADIPVIITSANTDPDWIETVRKMGVYDYIVKPYTNASVVERLAATLERLKADMATLPADK